MTHLWPFLKMRMTHSNGVGKQGKEEEGESIKISYQISQ